MTKEEARKTFDYEDEPILYLMAIHQNEYGMWAAVEEIPRPWCVKHALADETIQYAYAYGSKETCKEAVDTLNRFYQATGQFDYSQWQQKNK